MDLDDNFKRLIRELGYAINESLSESERIAEVMGRIRASGYDLLLVLEVTMGVNKTAEGSPDSKSKAATAQRRRTRQFKLTSQDAQFLRSLRISVDSDSA